MNHIYEYYLPILKEHYDDYPKRTRDLDHLHTIAEGYPAVNEFLADLALEPPDGSAVNVEAPDRDDERLVLSTIHSAKGLEWQCVFVIWVVDGRFPSMYSFIADEELEEERRLFYVSVTRAKRHLFLTYPINVYDKRSGMLLSKPSRFLDHVSSDLLDTLALVEEGGRGDWHLATRPVLLVLTRLSLRSPLVAYLNGMSMQRCAAVFGLWLTIMIVHIQPVKAGEELSARLWEQLIADATTLHLPTRFLKAMPADFVRFEFDDLHIYAAEYHPSEHRLVLNRSLSFNAAGRTLRPLTKMTHKEVGPLYHELFHAYMDFLADRFPDSSLLAFARNQQTCRYAEVTDYAGGAEEERNGGYDI